VEWINLFGMTHLQNAGEGLGKVRSWGEMIRLSAENPACAHARAALLGEAEKALGLGLVKRVYRLEDVGQHRTWLDGRSAALGAEIKETFALAMSDHATNRLVGEEMPMMAAAWVLTGEERFKQRLVEQLEEVASWSPLQRPGWTCYHPKGKLPADGKDGSWLATGTGVRAIATALDIVEPGVISEELAARLRGLLEKEVEQVVGDWKARRQWFVRGKNVLTNQWVLPTEGLVRACLVLGKEKHAEAYEMGVGNLLAAIDAHGEAGEFEEGLDYASFTVTSMFHAAHAMAVRGDDRAISRPFLKRFCLWAVHHLMPGGLGINAFDAFASGVIKRDCKHVREILGAGAVFAGDGFAKWALLNQLDGPLSDVVGLAACAGLSEGVKEPVLFSAYERATRVNWRSGWEENATGVWVRGGHGMDQHDHEDRGHVSFILRGKPVFIETGTPAYHHPDLGRLFASGAGHNVLQVGLNEPVAGGSEVRPVVKGWQKKGTVAPIATHKLDAEGGHVSVDVSKGYDAVAKWVRGVSWGPESLTVHDAVELKEGVTEVVVFRWHLGAREAVEIKGGGKVLEVVLPWAKVTIEATEEIELRQEMREGHSLVACGWDDPIPYPKHVCLVVRTVGVVGGVDVVTRTR
jgi:hypothetical protein